MEQTLFIFPAARVASPRWHDRHLGIRDLFLMLPLPNLIPITMACTFSSPLLPFPTLSWPAWQSLGAVWLEMR